jgi:hypothetical protein
LQYICEITFPPGEETCGESCCTPTSSADEQYW